MELEQGHDRASNYKIYELQATNIGTPPHRHKNKDHRIIIYKIKLVLIIKLLRV